MCFLIAFISLIIRCVTLVSYVRIVNGKPRKSFNPSRELQQSNPFSSYLFILCGSFLLSYIQTMKEVITYRREKFIGLIGIHYARPKKKVDWVLDLLKDLTLPSLKNKFGDVLVQTKHALICDPSAFGRAQIYEIWPILKRDNHEYMKFSPRADLFFL